MLRALGGLGFRASGSEFWGLGCTWTLKNLFCYGLTYREIIIRSPEKVRFFRV